jgi:beta-galactosidase
MKKKPVFAILIISILIGTAFAGCVGKKEIDENARIRKNIDFDWKFYKDIEGKDILEVAEKSEFDDSDWRKVDLPHDWSIEGPFSKDNPSGSAGGALPGGIGWYRKHFEIPKENEGKKIFVEFDGIYMNSDVWINGNHLGNHPFGYTSFYYDTTPYLKYGDENVLAVKVDNSKQPNSRWYSGSGIYRHVWLVITDRLHVGHWGTFVTTPEVLENHATVDIKTTVVNEYNKPKNCILVSKIIDMEGNVVKTVESSHEIPTNNEYEFCQVVDIDSPHLWFTEDPYLYKVYSMVKDGDNLVDDYETTFGIRTFYFDADRGFFLNGKKVKILGTCNHHDDSCFGAAVPDRGKERKIQLLKEMGSNAIRTCHNPPTPELLDYCDKYGMLVMDEAFDCWRKGKTEYDYHLYFDEWGIKDLKSMIRRDRNHPSIIIWSVGNEIPEMGSSDGVPILKSLIKATREEDSTRPITVGVHIFGTSELANVVGTTNLLDVAGYNYADHILGISDLLDFAGYNFAEPLLAVYDIDHMLYPDRKMIATETTSEMSSRGVYKKAYDIANKSAVFNMIGSGDDHCSAYDDTWLQGWSHQGACRAIRQGFHIRYVHLDWL